MQTLTARAAFDLHFDAIYGEHDWPAGAVLSLPAMVNGRWKGSYATAPVEADAVWAAIERAGANASVYVSVGVRRPGTTGQGGAADVLAHPALVADVDVQSGTHASDKLPTEAQALAWIADLPEAPTVVTRTGGGFHVWMALRDPVDLSQGDGALLHAGWVAWWQSRAAQDGRHIDGGPLANIAGVLRPAGATNAKYGTMVTIESSAPTSLPLSAAIAAFPAPVREPAVARLNSQLIDVGTDKPGTAFARHLPADRFLVENYGARTVGVLPGVVHPDGSPIARGLQLPRPDGSYAPQSEDSIRVHLDEDGVCRVTVHGARTQQLLNLEDGQHSLSSFDLLAIQLGQNGERDYGAAARKISRERRASGISSTSPEVPVTDGTIEPIVTGSSADTVVVPDDVSELAPTLADALAAWNGTRIDLKKSDHSYVIIGTHQHGLWVGAGDAKVQLTDWVGYCKTVTQKLTVSVDAVAARTKTEPTFVMEIVDRHRRSTISGELERTVAFNTSRLVVEMQESSVLPPASTKMLGHVNNMLLGLGAADGARTRTNIYGSAGWVTTPGHNVYVAPAGSIDSSGVAPAAQMGDVSGRPVAHSKLGWPKISDDITRDMTAVQLLMGISPENPAIPVATLGIGLSAILPQQSGTTVWLLGDTQSAKSRAMSCAQSFWVGGGVAAKSFVLNLTDDNSPAGIQARAEWARHGVATMDDFRTDLESPVHNAAVKAVVTTMVQKIFGDSNTAKANQDGTARDIRPMRSMAIITAEETSSLGEAIINRSVVVRVAPTDVARHPMGSSPLDVFAECAREGAPRRLFAAFVQWVAAWLDRAGFESVENTVEERKRSWAPSSGREAMTAATVWVGWAFFRDFAREHGVEHLLPAEDVIDRTAKSLIAVSEETAATSGGAVQIIEKLRDMAAAGKGHFTNYLGEVPEFPDKFGYELFGDNLRARGERIGQFSRDGKYLLVPNETLNAVVRALGFNASAERVGQLLKPHVVEGTTPRGKAPAMMQLGNGRPRGSVFDASLLFDLAPQPPADVPF